MRYVDMEPMWDFRVRRRANSCPEFLGHSGWRVVDV